MAATEEERRRSLAARAMPIVLTMGSLASGVNAVLQLVRALLGMLH